ncbi:MAG: hypothetical protein ACPGOV_16225 [Magnetovibrionaceae bacterium]
MKTFALTLFMTLCLLAPANAGPLTPTPTWPQSHPLHQEVKLGCVQVVNLQGRPSLINRCNQCRIVSLQRKRPSDTVPISRTFTIPAKSTIEHAFRGPGRTRITSDAACEAVTPNPQSGGVASADGERCIGFRKAGGQILVVNTCRVCRTAQIERFGNGPASQATVMVGPRSFSALAREGASQARVLAEAGCG